MYAKVGSRHQTAAGAVTDEKRDMVVARVKELPWTRTWQGIGSVSKAELHWV